MSKPRLTLTPNRTPGPPRTARIVVYRRQGAAVYAVDVIHEAGLWRDERRPLRTIAREDPTSTNGVDREWLAAWVRHVRANG